MAKKTEKKDFDFAKSYKELQKIAEEFESGGLSLDEGLKKFEEGLKIAKQCKEYIEKIENKIVQIKKKYK